MTQTAKLIRRTYHADRDCYWKAIEANRTDGKLVAWCFDFVSIHKNRGHYSLLGASCLVGPKGERPKFESRRFESFADAKAYAMRVVRGVRSHKLHVVNCTKG
jgi:hypothetical protein